MAPETIIYHELPGDYVHPCRPSVPQSATVLQPATHLNFSRPRPPLLSRTHLGNAGGPTLEPTGLHMYEDKTMSSGSHCIAFGDNTENMPIMEDGRETEDERPDMDIDFGVAESDDHYGEVGPPPVSRSNDRCLASSPAVPSSVMRWRDMTLDAPAEFDTSDASSMLTAESESTGLTAETSILDDASIRAVDSTVCSSDGRLGWTPGKMSPAGRGRQRFALPTPSRPTGSNGIVSEPPPPRNPIMATKTGGKRRPSPIKILRFPEQAPPLPTPPLMTRHITFEQHVHNTEPALMTIQTPVTPSRTHSDPPSTCSSAVSEHRSGQNNGHTSVGSVQSIPQSITLSGEWRSGGQDVSGMTEAQIKKLKRKGINPVLYAEMQSARLSGPDGDGRLIGASTSRA